MISRTPSRSCTLSPSSKVPSQRVLSRSHTTHLILRGFTRATASLEISFLSPSSFTRYVSLANTGALSNFRAGALRNGDFLDLIAAFNDFHDLGVPIKAFYRVLAAASVCAMDLDGVPRDFRGIDASEVFGNRSLDH